MCQRQQIFRFIRFWHDGAEHHGTHWMLVVVACCLFVGVVCRPLLFVRCVPHTKRRSRRRNLDLFLDASKNKFIVHWISAFCWLQAQVIRHVLVVVVMANSARQADALCPLHLVNSVHWCNVATYCCEVIVVVIDRVNRIRWGKQRATHLRSESTMLRVQTCFYWAHWFQWSSERRRWCVGAANNRYIPFCNGE